MLKTIKPAPIIITVVIAAVLQLGMIAADCRQSPTDLAKNFTKAYYYLDADMQDYLCENLAADGEAVNNYLHEKSVEANQRGLSTNYLRHKFQKLHASVVESTEDSMKVHLTGSTRVCLNPAFMLVGKLFNIGDDHPVDETLEMVKENKKWRVCGTPFGMRPQN